VISRELVLSVPGELVEAIAQRVAELVNQPDTNAATPASPWLTFGQACDYLGLSRDALYKLTAAKAIPCRKKQGGQGLRFHRHELDEWMRERYPRVDRIG
jgi:excisionase family DNA binding protein